MGRLEDDLLRPENYPPPRPAAVGLVETSRSLVFLGDREAWRILRPLGGPGPGPDRRDPAVRERLCHEEVRLNRRLSPDVYRGVLPVRRDGEGHSLVRGGEIVDFAVRMRLLPAERSARRLLEEGSLDFHQVEALARRMADFYGAAAKVPRPGGAGTLAARLEEDLAAFESVESRVAPAGGGGGVRRFLRAFLRREAALLRSREERALEAHGDLRLDHVYFEHRAGAPTVVAAVDLHERFGALDPAADLALLAADLEAGCREDLAERFVAVAAAGTGDFGMYSVLDFHACWRAVARAANLLLDAAGAGRGAAAGRGLVEEARRLFAVALSRSRPRPGGGVLALSGAVGTGKSTLAAALSRRLGLPVLAGDGGPCPGREGLRRARAAMLRDAETVLATGRGVILDAPFRTRGRRAAARRLAERRGLPFLLVETRCPPSILRERLRRRPAGEGNGIPEEGWRTFEAVVEGPPGEHLVVDTSLPAERLAEEVASRFRDPRHGEPLRREEGARVGAGVPPASNGV